MRHEITSWRLDESLDAHNNAFDDKLVDTHIVLVVDSSGSMRKNDMTGYETRTAAVYDTITERYLKPQLELNESSGKIGNAVVSLIEMSSESNLIIQRAKITPGLLDRIRARKLSRAHHHGNYLLALDEVFELLTPDYHNDTRLQIIFLSDGAPSDQNEIPCDHGYLVWHTAHGAGNTKGVCPIGKTKDCRNQVRNKVIQQCTDKINLLGETFGVDRVQFYSVAIGNPTEDFTILEKISKVLPNGSFSKLGLSTDLLSTTFTSMTSTLTSLRTDTGFGGMGHATRTDKSKEDAEKASKQIARDLELREAGKVVPIDITEYDMYFNSSKVNSGGYNHHKLINEDLQYIYEHRAKNKKRWLKSSTGYEYREETNFNGIAMKKSFFAKGAERFAYRGIEFKLNDSATSRNDLWIQTGSDLVVKESSHPNDLKDSKFHTAFAKTQVFATIKAYAFNKAVSTIIMNVVRATSRQASQLLQIQNKIDNNQPILPHLFISFLDCAVYEVTDPRSTLTFGTGTAWILAEKMLQGKYTKWNNNNGSVLKKPESLTSVVSAKVGAIDAIIEGDEEDEDDEIVDDLEASFVPMYDVPQAFSHFSFKDVVHDGGLPIRCLICDIQGTWNPYDGFNLTDPAVHTLGRKGERGSTDKGTGGIRKFFETHKCNILCSKLGLLDASEELSRLCDDAAKAKK